MASDRIVKALLFAYGAGLAVTGVWAAIAPRSFYDDFPGFGRHWVAVAGEPYNEHLVRDVGQLYLALTAMTIAAAVFFTVRLVQVVTAASVIAGAPHFLYHVAHLDKLDTPDQIGNVIATGSLVLVPIVILVMVSRRPAPAH